MEKLIKEGKEIRNVKSLKFKKMLEVKKKNNLTCTFTDNSIDDEKVFIIRPYFLT